MIICSHGSSAIEHRKNLEDLSDFINKNIKSIKCFHCFLEKSEPSIDNCISSVIKKYDRIFFFPLFLFKGRHFKSDITDKLKKFSNIKKIQLIKKLSLQEDLLPIVVKNMKKKLKKDQKNILITLSSMSKENCMIRELDEYTKKLASELNIKDYHFDFITNSKGLVEKIHNISNPNIFFLVHPVIYFDGFLQKNIMEFFKTIKKEKVFILSPLINIKELKRYLVKKLKANL